MLLFMNTHLCDGFRDASHPERAVQLPALRKQREKLLARISELAIELSSRRRLASGQLRLSVESCLRRLAMPHSRFDVRIAWDLAPEPAGPSSAQSLLVDNQSAATVGALPPVLPF